MIHHEAVQTKPTDSGKPSQVSVTKNTLPIDKAFHLHASLYTTAQSTKLQKAAPDRVESPEAIKFLPISWARVDDLQMYTVSNDQHQVSSSFAYTREI